MNIQDKYNAWSDSYDSDRNLTRDLDKTELKRYLNNLRPARTLELGCGTGKNTQFLSEVSRQVIAADYSAGMMSRAIRKRSLKNVSFTLMDISKPWPFRKNTFDLALCSLVLEHISDLHQVFSEASRVLVKRGIFYISELHPYRQYQGKKAEFSMNGERVEISSYLHNITDFTTAAENNGFILEVLRESWHNEDAGKYPRLILFGFRKI